MVAAARRPVPAARPAYLADSTHGTRGRSGGGPAVARGRLLGRGLDDDVAVGAGQAERRHGGAARAVGVGPRLRLGQQPDRAGRPVDLRGGLVHVQGARQQPVPDGLHHLDDPRHAGGGLRVAEVGLDGAEPQRRVRVAVAAVGGQQRLRLDGVAEPGAGAVRLHRVDVLRGQSGVGERGADDPFLRRPVGCGQPVGRAVLVDRGAAHDGEHAVPVAPRVGQPFQHQYADALGPRRAVGGRGERPAPAALGEPALAGELVEGAGGGHHAHAAGQRQRAVAAAQRLRGEVHGDERGGARGVDGQRRAGQAECVGDPPGRDGRGGAGADVAAEVLIGQQDGNPVVLAHQAGEHAGRGAARGVGVDRWRAPARPRTSRAAPVAAGSSRWPRAG